MKFNYSYKELIDGLSIDGSPLPQDDSKLNIGDFWELTYVGQKENGERVNQIKSVSTKFSVGTRFAGTYKVTKCEYWRIGVIKPDLTDPFLGTEITIESVNATTYKKLGYAGPFTGNSFFFTIDSNGVIEVPVTYDGKPQLLNDLPTINCSSPQMSNACGFAGIQNKAVKDDVTKKDKLYLFMAI